MKDNAIFFRVDQKIKKKLQDIAKADRRSVASLVLLWIEDKLNQLENQNARTNNTS